MSTDVLTLGISGGKHLYLFIIRWYGNGVPKDCPTIERRVLGDHRVAYDFGRVSFVCERYDCG